MAERRETNMIKALRAFITDRPGFLGKLLTTIGNCGGNIGDLRLIKRGSRHNFRELEIYVSSEEHMEEILHTVGQLDGIQIDSVNDVVLEVHRGGKIEMVSKTPIIDPGDLRKIYTPGVAEVCKQIQREPETYWDFTFAKNSVAIVTNGTAILGLGNIGAKAGMPVMEGKAVLFAELVGLSGIPLLVHSEDPAEVVKIVSNISETFGAIQLEDFAAPACFQIEKQLQEKLNIPVMHDDQHGTAVVTLAALMNATRYSGESLKLQKVGIVGLGAAGMGIAKLLKAYGVKVITGSDINPEANELFEQDVGPTCNLEELMKNSTVVVATTGVPQLISPKLVQPRQIILALSNPNPEITPEDATEAGAAFAADGRGVNNALAFPGIFKGALSARATRITNHMKIAAATTLSEYANRSRQDLVPALMNKKVHKAISDAVEKAAYESGVVRVIKPAESI